MRVAPLAFALAMASAALAQPTPPPAPTNDNPQPPPDVGTPGAAAPEPSGASMGDPGTAAQMGSPSAVVSPSSPMPNPTAIPGAPYHRPRKALPKAEPKPDKAPPPGA